MFNIYFIAVAISRFHRYATSSWHKKKLWKESQNVKNLKMLFSQRGIKTKCSRGIKVIMDNMNQKLSITKLRSESFKLFIPEKNTRCLAQSSRSYYQVNLAVLYWIFLLKIY